MSFSYQTQNPVVTLIAIVIGCLIIGFPLYTMGNKIGSQYAWFGFVPLLNILLMCEIAEKPLWWIVLMLIPCVNIVVGIILWMAIAERMGKPSWMGILMIVPCLNLAMPYIIAFT